MDGVAAEVACAVGALGAYGALAKGDVERAGPEFFSWLFHFFVAPS